MKHKKSIIVYDMTHAIAKSTFAFLQLQLCLSSYFCSLFPSLRHCCTYKKALILKIADTIAMQLLSWN